MNRQEEPIDLRNFRTAYFDTSAWNYLSKHNDRAQLVHRIKDTGTIVLASVISVGEVLRTNDDVLRQLLCSTMRTLHGDGLLLGRPQDLAVAATEALRRGGDDMLLPRSGPGRALLSYMHNPTSPPKEDIHAWLMNMDGNLNRFLNEIKPIKADTKTRYCSPEIFELEGFLQALCHLPPVKQLNVSISEMRQLCEKSDIWKGFGAVLAYIIELSVTHAPIQEAGKNGNKRPGGPDLWQVAYVGVVETFATNDVPQLEAARRISGCLRYRRQVLSAKAFMEGIVPCRS